MRALFSAFVEYLKGEGYKGVLVGATDYEGYMHHSHFAKRGFRVIREGDGGKLMYLRLAQETVEAEPLAPRIPMEGKAPVEVLIVGSRFCPGWERPRCFTCAKLRPSSAIGCPWWRFRRGLRPWPATGWPTGSS